MQRKEIEAFLLSKKGYIKKSPSKVAIAIHKLNPKIKLSSITFEEAARDLKLIREVQANLRTATAYISSKEEEDVVDAYMKILAHKAKPKTRLFFDIEVSPNIVLSWRTGNNINLSHETIVNERAIICVCWKWAGDSTIHSLRWNNGDDKDLVKKFSQVINSADEVVTQNGDAFDIKWLRTRCLYHRVPLSVKFNSIDTLKMARTQFKFNSNKLDYMGKFLGIGGKIKTDPDLWANILLRNDRKAMDDMITYCKMDVQRLEEVYNELQNYSPVKKFKYKF